MSIIYAPWNDGQAIRLNEWQACEYAHPFTCGRHSHSVLLVATTGGWICPECDYTQDWAHDFMFGPMPTNPSEVLESDTQAELNVLRQMVSKLEFRVERAEMAVAFVRNYALLLPQCSHGVDPDFVKRVSQEILNRTANVHRQ